MILSPYFLNRFFAALILIAYVGAIPTAVNAQIDTLSETEYWAQIDATLDLVASLDAAEPSSHTTLVAAADRYAAITAIQLNDGSVMPIDNSFLVALLRQDPPDLNAIQAHLNALVRQQGVPDETSSADNQPTFVDILTRPEFQWQEEQQNPIEEWIREQITRLINWLRRYIPGFNTPSGTSPLILMLGGLLLALIIGFALRGVLIDLVGSADLKANEDESGIPLTAATALQKAQDTAQGGDYRNAVRYLYLSTLLQLEEHHLLRYDRARTNREYLRSVAHLPELAILLQDVVDVFDRVWYGYQPIDEHDFQTFVARVTALRHYR